MPHPTMVKDTQDMTVDKGSQIQALIMYQARGSVGTLLVMSIGALRKCYEETQIYLSSSHLTCRGSIPV